MRRNAGVLIALLTVGGLFATAVCGECAVLADAQVSPSEVASAEHLVSPGVQWCIAHGLPLAIVNTQAIEPAAVYTQATEKYSAQVRLGADESSLEHYVAGRPFPTIDVQDPSAAVRIMLNVRFGEGIDDITVPRFRMETGRISPDAPMAIERYFLVDSYRRLYYIGRLWTEPTPTIANDEGLHYKEAMRPFVEPFDLKGTGMIRYRYLSQTRPDDAWIYVPALRRVRRLPTTNSSDAAFGQDTDQDSYGGYSGKLGPMTWRLLGEREILAPLHTTNAHVRWAAPPADWAFDAEWERRLVYVIEGTPIDRESCARRVLYVDTQGFIVSYADMYDQSGQLWRVWISNFRFQAQAPDSTMPGAMMVDVQANHATRYSSPDGDKDEPSASDRSVTSANTDSEFTIARLLELGG